MKPLIGHTAPDGKSETLDEHSRKVADAVRSLVRKFGAAEFGYVAGYLHDLGKAKPEFQAYLRGERGSEPHAAEGAKLAVEHFKSKCPPPFSAALGRLLAFPIAGHHAGLANGRAAGGGLSPLKDRLDSAEAIAPWFPLETLPDLRGQVPVPLRAARRLRADGKIEADPFGWQLFVRMLFSALVDADSIETERWMSTVAGEPIERGWQGSLSDLRSQLDGHLSAFDASASEIARLRAEVLADCRAAAAGPTGILSLTVPTGGGKTLSSLAFALDHAIAHGLDRIIYVIPFTSIVEQTAAVFRRALRDETSDGAVLEHHSAFDDGADRQDAYLVRREGAERRRLAAQNWDRPIIVTTAVQLFESLFANKKARCRKLHNIARSVVVLDEAQTLPISLLRPCLAVLDELRRGYRVSVVLCTATQPALTKAAGLRAPEALKDVREIVQPGRDLYRRLDRVRTEQAGILTDDQLAAHVGAAERGLVIVNTRRHARELAMKLTEAGVAGTRHLSTSMTAAHRQKVLERARSDLNAGLPVRLVSTSLIEAGVDVSFDAVWRAWAGLDQIAQAAGRCNREGALGLKGGLLTIFTPAEGEGRKPPAELAQNAETAKRVLHDGIDPLSPEAVARYFRELLWTKDDGKKLAELDKVKVGEAGYAGIIAAIEATAPGLDFCFADIAEAFRFIADAQVPVIIPASAHAIAGVDDDILERIRFATGLGGLMRRLQRHIVQIPRSARDAMLREGAAGCLDRERFGDQFVVLNNYSLYSDSSGLDWINPTLRKVTELIM